MGDITLWQGLISAIGIAWIGWVSLTLISVSTRNSVSKQEITQLVQKFDGVCEEMKDNFNGMKTEVQRDIVNVNRRFDIFLKTEIDTLKDIAKDHYSGK